MLSGAQANQSVTCMALCDKELHEKESVWAEPVDEGPPC